MAGSVRAGDRMRHGWSRENHRTGINAGKLQKYNVNTAFLLILRSRRMAFHAGLKFLQARRGVCPVHLPGDASPPSHIVTLRWRGRAGQSRQPRR